MSYVPGLERLFDEAKQQILEAKWTDFDLNKSGQDILPLPDLSSELRLPSHRLALGNLLPTEREQELTWAHRATEFVNWYKERVEHNLREMERNLADELAAWNHNHPPKKLQLLLENTFREWKASIQSLSLAEFSQLSIGAETAYQFLTPKFNELNKRYGTRADARTATTLSQAKKSLSLRQIALLCIYQGISIGRGEEANKIARLYGHQSGEKLYKHYNNHTITCDRTCVEGGKIKPLIKDITAVIPYLYEQQKRQAENETNTLKAKIQDRS